MVEGFERRTGMLAKKEGKPNLLRLKQKAGEKPMASSSFTSHSSGLPKLETVFPTLHALSQHPQLLHFV